MLTSMTVIILMVGCVASPDTEEKGLLAGTQRVLALDFGRRSAGPRIRRLTRLPTVFAGELRRAQNGLGLQKDRPLTAATTSEFRRFQRLPKQGQRLLRSELKRRPKLFEGAWPSSFEFAKNTANDIDRLGRMLGPSQRPLDEINDYTHRTDHNDKRPVPTLWQRLRRRLPF